MELSSALLGLRSEKKIPPRKKIFIFQKMKLLGSNVKRFKEMETLPKKFFVFWEIELFSPSWRK